MCFLRRAGKNTHYPLTASLKLPAQISCNQRSAARRTPQPPPLQKVQVKPVSWFKINLLQQGSARAVCSIPIISPQSTERGLANYFKFGIDMKWISELKVLLVRSVFEKTLSANQPSPVQTTPRSFCLPASHGARSLPWQHHLLFITTLPLGLFVSARTVKMPDLPSAQLQASTMNFCCFLGRLWRLVAIWADVSEMLLLSHLYWCCCNCSCLVWASHQCHRTRPAPYEISIFY